MASILTTAAHATDGDALFEEVNGEIVEIPPMGVYEGLIATLLTVHLQNFVGSKLGRIVTEVLFDFTKTLGKKRRPDLAFVSYARWPREKQPPRTEAWDVVPNIAVEVVSPTNPADDVVDKIADYFQAGVERVWVIYPTQRQLYAYTSPTELKVLAETDELLDETLLPGFRCKLATLFNG